MTQNKKNYRPNVAAIVLSSEYPQTCDVFIATRVDIQNDSWQFPQGGIDEGEKPEEALYRELREEIGTDNVSIVAVHPDWISYDFPKTVAKKMVPFDGQIQKYYLVKLNHGAVINLKTKIPEFSKYKFVPSSNIFDFVTYFKRTVYKEVLHYFKQEGYI